MLFHYECLDECLSQFDVYALWHVVTPLLGSCHARIEDIPEVSTHVLGTHIQCTTGYKHNLRDTSSEEYLSILDFYCAQLNNFYSQIAVTFGNRATWFHKHVIHRNAFSNYARIIFKSSSVESHSVELCWFDLSPFHLPSIFVTFLPVLISLFSFVHIKGKKLREITKECFYILYLIGMKSEK